MLVTFNHQITITELRRLCDVELSDLEDSLADLDYETVASAKNWASRSYEELESAANQLALVSLVTRLDVWLNKLIVKHAVQRVKAERVAYLTGLGKNMASIVARLSSDPPISIEYFDSLATVRDAVIHADSLSDWEFQDKPRLVSQRYKSPYGTVSFTKEDLDEATHKSIEQFHALERALGS